MLPKSQIDETHYNWEHSIKNGEAQHRKAVLGWLIHNDSDFKKGWKPHHLGLQYFGRNK